MRGNLFHERLKKGEVLEKNRVGLRGVHGGHERRSEVWFASRVDAPREAHREDDVYCATTEGSEDVDGFSCLDMPVNVLAHVIQL